MKWWVICVLSLLLIPSVNAQIWPFQKPTEQSLYEKALEDILFQELFLREYIETTPFNNLTVTTIDVDFLNVLVNLNVTNTTFINSTVFNTSSISTDNLTIRTLPNCDSVDTDASGQIFCGTDQDGSGNTTAQMSHAVNISGINTSYGSIDILYSTYLHGDGSNITGIQQGNLVLYFLEKESLDITGNKTLSIERNDTKVTLTGSGLGDGSTKFYDWMTDSNVPNTNFLPAGTWFVSVNGAKTSGTKNVQFYYEIYQTDENGNDERLISTSVYSDYLTASEATYEIETYNSGYALNTTDRIRVKGYAYVTGTGTAPDAEAYIQGDTNTRIEISTGSITVNTFVPYTGATKNVDLGNYNETVNSLNVTNILYLPNSDWCFKDGGGGTLVLTSDC